MPRVVYWQNFDPEKFEYEFDETELAGHHVTIDEAAEVLWNGFQVQRNKGVRGGYQLVGHTDAGRALKLIVHEKHKGLIRVITGWDL